jgi:hypothetical protein
LWSNLRKIFGDKVALSLVLVVFNDRVTVKRYQMDGDVKLDQDRTIQGIGGGAVSHVECDGDWVLVGYSRKIMLFSHETCECHLVLRPGYIGCVALHYQYCTAVGEDGGLSIWDLISGNKLKTIGNTKFWKLHYMVAF